MQNDILTTTPIVHDLMAVELLQNTNLFFTFKTDFDFTCTSLEVVQASITLHHKALHFCCLYRPPPNRKNNLTESMFTEQLHDRLDYINNLPGLILSCW